MGGAPPAPRRPRRAAAPLLFLLGALAVLLPGSAEAKGSITRVESEFERAIRNVTPATVVCLPWGVDAKLVPQGTSGVIMSRKGLVLSDGDVGTHFDQVFKQGVQPKVVVSDVIEVRMPHLKGKGFRSFKATVLHRSRENDTSLMRMESPPSGLKPLTPGSSDALRVGDFSFAMGNSFGLAEEAPPTLTAGVVAALVKRKEPTGGLYEAIYTSAAVNPGVNGGPLVDIHGHLIGTISSAVRLPPPNSPAAHHPDLAFAYFGKVVPVARLRAVYADKEEFAELFADEEPRDPKTGDSASLATVYHLTARHAYRALVSLEIKRKSPISLIELFQGRPVTIPRYLGAVSGTLVSPDGYLLTSLYNLTNIAVLANPDPRYAARMPDAAKVEAGLAAIESVTVYLPDGRAVQSKLVARHEGIGLALLKADVGEGCAPLQTLPPAPVESMMAGRFVLALGSPFGKERLDDPLLTVGILSKEHDLDVAEPWAGQWQTDAGVTDANAGGAAVDLRGRLQGILTIWSSTMHGRNSGIGFIAPWSQIAEYLPEMMRGRTFRKPYMGVGFKALDGIESTILGHVTEGQAAAEAGLKVGDEIVRLDGEAVTTPAGLRAILRKKWADDKIRVTYRRGGAEAEAVVTLGAR